MTVIEPEARSAPAYRTFTQSRTHLRDVMDAAAAGLTPTVGRENETYAVIDTTRLRHTLAALIDPDTQVFHEAGEWGGYLPLVPSVSGTGDTLDDLMQDLVGASREYADDWRQYLRTHSNHQDAWGFVQLVDLSSDDELRAWLSAER